MGQALDESPSVVAAAAAAVAAAEGTAAAGMTGKGKKKFVPNHVSNYVFLVNLAQAVAVPLAVSEGVAASVGTADRHSPVSQNYAGRPFMQEALAYRPLVVSLVATLLLGLAAMMGWVGGWVGGVLPLLLASQAAPFPPLPHSHIVDTHQR